jgi:hypothetical protein
MKTRRIFQFSTVFILALMLMISLATSACADNPWPWFQSLPWSTATPWPTPRALRVGESFSFGVVSVPATPAPPPLSSGASRSNPASLNVPPPDVNPRSSASPQNALMPDGSPHILAAGASVWYKVGKGGEHIDVFLDSPLLSGMVLQIYAPGNLSDPVGQGTLQKGTGRLAWAGGHWNSDGDWMARVTNNNPLPANYTLTSSVRDISNKSCYGYWEYLPTGQYVYWSECR